MSSSRSATKKSSASSRKTAAKKTTAKKTTKTTAKKSTAKKTSAKKVVKKTKSSSDEVEDPTVAMCRSLAQIVEAHELSELIIDNESLTLTIRRGAHHAISTAPSHGHTMHLPMAAPAPAAAPAAAAVEAPVVDDNLHEVTSPFVGTFYRAPNPDSSSYCEVGQRVEKGQVLCIVEAMKLMNEIEADSAGILEAILVENAEPVEYGQPLFKIKA